MNLRLEPMPDNPTRAAICFGPVVLAGELGSEGIVPPMPYAVDQGEYFTFLPPEMPILLAAGRAVDEWIEPVPDRPLTFRTKGVGQPQAIALVAFYKMQPQRYSIYWDIITQEQWTERQAQKEQNIRRAQELTASTLDSIAIGNAESERAHNLNGENTSFGAFLNRSYRHAENGGWFSYDLNVPPEQPVKLLCTFWGSDGGPRLFDILINNTCIATQRLNYDHPNEFFNVVHSLSPEILGARTTLTVRFQAHPGRMAGGIFDLRVLKSDDQ
ncbi:MAG: hypothetical protein EHM72_20505 [Calditrichaeota bacterium]|nr:MAG: hypothetical protein EHM72_20505 [Calditrichota bacterium]